MSDAPLRPDADDAPRLSPYTGGDKNGYEVDVMLEWYVAEMDRKTKAAERNVAEALRSRLRAWGGSAGRLERWFENL